MSNDKREQEKQQIREQWEKDKADLEVYKEQLRLEKEAAKKQK